MLENLYEGLNARPKVYLSKECFCEMYPTCVSSKLCEFIYLFDGNNCINNIPMIFGHRLTSGSRWAEWRSRYASKLIGPR